MPGNPTIPPEPENEKMKEIKCVLQETNAMLVKKCKCKKACLSI